MKNRSEKKSRGFARRRMFSDIGRRSPAYYACYDPNDSLLPEEEEYFTFYDIEENCLPN